MKRLLDLVVSLAALLLLSPVLLGAAVAVVWGSGWPIFYRQQRVGRGGQTFGMLKFRSMHKDADAVGPYFTAANDARITPVGRFLRRTSIDELPQIINVLMGDMSLVGPRPDVPAQQPLYSSADWVRRCSVLPGITGLAQVKGRSECTFAQRLAFDLQYVSNSTVWLDVKILTATVIQLRRTQSN
ncbi:MAG: sugar transferase [Chitinophagaceae bacterium]|nr:sugar transferase [Polaromonas sp.]